MFLCLFFCNLYVAVEGPFPFQRVHHTPVVYQAVPDTRYVSDVTGTGNEFFGRRSSHRVGVAVLRPSVSDRRNSYSLEPSVREIMTLLLGLMSRIPLFVGLRERMSSTSKTCFE